MTRIDLVTGFLGAGKTTFIKKYGSYLKRKNINFAVVENEFGAAGVDSAILQSEFGNVTELAGGCICCTMKTGFHQVLSELSQTYDRIIVEPSGIFNCDDFFDVISNPDLKDRCLPGMCITLIDPHTIDKLDGAERSVLAAELSDTGCILWTKMDMPPQIDINRAKDRIKDIVKDIGVEEDIPCYPTPSHTLGDEDFEKLMEVSSVRRMHIRTYTDHTMVFQSARIYPEGVYSVKDIESCVEQLTSCGEYGEISRIKGFVKSHDGTMAVNCTVSDRQFEILDAGWAMLNVIGRNLNREKIIQCLNYYAIQWPRTRGGSHRGTGTLS
ncbi:MAG: GTP-binding protein [Clostridiaceae bacterium]|jgi:G3E family GTPase|nr:GTP-binding protein [Clostridiaceae bacterium]